MVKEKIGLHGLSTTCGVSQGAEGHNAEAKSKAESGFVLLANLVKDLSHANDPQLKEAGKARRKSLKALLKSLQQPDVSQAEREQLLLKALVNQVFTQGQIPPFFIFKPSMRIEHHECRSLFAYISCSRSQTVGPSEGLSIQIKHDS